MATFRPDFVLGLSIALLAVIQSSVAHELVRRASVCYGDLGCFSTAGQLHSLPYKPAEIQTTFTLKLRGNSYAAVVKAVDDPNTWHSTLAGSGFSAAKETKVIVHGYVDSGTTGWVGTMATELLKKGDYNVFVTDWGHGSRSSYPQAAANSFVVAAQLAKFINSLHTREGVDLAKVHLIGHSLGAQISGNAGSKCSGLGRISALDPAEPIFKTEVDDSKRIDKSDATFVDVIHTDGADFNLLQGYGLKDPVGHVDFYPNGGVDQPGCTDSAVLGILGAVGGGHDNSIACSHSRSHEYFTESINSNCRFDSHPCNSWADYEKGTCHGCPTGGCPQMGFNAVESSARGSYYVSTAESSPYCGHEYFVEMDLTGERVYSYGRIYLTFLGNTRNSREIEFTSENRHYHANDKEMHMLSLHTEVGSVTGVKVRFHRGDGLASLGTQHHITVHRIVLEDAVAKQRTTFCTHDHIINDDRCQTFRSHNGC
ncbi:inactive pancreatic lipase-related protein 1-like isoform X2 [Littorina saxatilis]